MTTPVYKKIYIDIKQNIKSGVYPVGSLIPTETELRDTYGVSRTTIRKVVSILVNEGFLQVKQGFGTTVLNNSTTQSLNKITSITETLKANGHTVETHGMYIDKIPTPIGIAKALSLPNSSYVYRVQRIQYADGHPIAYITNYLRSDLIPDFEQYIDKFTSLYSFLEATYGIVLTKADEKLSAISASFTDAQILNASVNASILLSKRIAYTDQGPFEYAIIKFAPDKYEYSIHLEGR